MREIYTKDIEIGEHVLIEGMEYVVEEDVGTCESCDMNGCGFCYLIPCVDGLNFKRVKEQPIGKQDKDTPMTRLQLAEWLAKGFGQYRFGKGITESTVWIVEKNEEDLQVGDILIRPWGTDEWVKPTVEIYKRDCGK